MKPWDGQKRQQNTSLCFSFVRVKDLFISENRPLKVHHTKEGTISIRRIENLHRVSEVDGTNFYNCYP